MKHTVIEDLKHDWNAPWWVTKHRPENLFDAAPIPCTIFIGVWLIAAIIPVIIMLSKL